jgi:hypothetical protein
VRVARVGVVENHVPGHFQSVAGELLDGGSVAVVYDGYPGDRRPVDALQLLEMNAKDPAVLELEDDRLHLADVFDSYQTLGGVMSRPFR